VGLDLGNQYTHFCVLDYAGSVVEEGRLLTNRRAFERRFGRQERLRVVLEAGADSPWVSRQLSALGHETIVANPQRLRAIAESIQKSDRIDARMLADLGLRFGDRLQTVSHRPEELQRDLEVIRGRQVLVLARTQLVNHVRGALKSAGHRLPATDARFFHTKAARSIPPDLLPLSTPLLTAIATLTQQIQVCDRAIEELIETKYPVARCLQQIPGVGPLISLTFVLTIADPTRFSRTRTVGAYLGLVPRLRQSGARNPQLHITHAGDSYLRQLLVQGAHYILGYRGPDSNLRRWGLAHAASGGPAAKKRAVTAVARKLAVLLLHLWLSGEVYEPLHGQKEVAAA
jgi:transposase